MAEDRCELLKVFGAQCTKMKYISSGENGILAQFKEPLKGENSA